MSVRCPKCAEAISIDGDIPPTEVLCSSCGAAYVQAKGETVTFIRDGSDETVTYVPASNSSSGFSNHAGDTKQLGDYELLEEIARGGMGVVYKARQVSLNRIVALKMIKSGELAGEDENRRFRAEAEAAAKLDHPNIVPIYEVGEFNGQQFFSMGYVEGSSLVDRLKDGPLAPREAADLIRVIADAVQYAHDKGIVHRDLKPANVLIDADGTPRITDFGLAKNIAGDSGMTATGQVMGTPSYMPPEQARGKTDEIGPPADVYSLGAMLYALVTGRPPFQAANVVETLKQVCEQEPVSPRQMNPAVSRDLETICLKCLNKDPEKRFPAASILAKDIQCYLNGRPISSRPISHAARIVRWCRRNSIVASLIGLSGLFLLTGLIASTWFGLEADQRATDLAVAQGDLIDERDNALDLSRRNGILATQKQELADRAGTLAASNLTLANQYKESAENERNARMQTAAQRYVAVIQVSWAAWKQGDIGRTRQLLKSLIPLDGEEDRRNWEWFYLTALCDRNLLAIEAHKGAVHAIAWNSDKTRLASVGEDGALCLWDAKTGRRIWNVKAHQGIALTVSWNSDGNRIATGGSDGQLKIWNSRDGALVRSIRVGAPHARCVAWSPNGQSIAFVARSETGFTATLQIIDAESGKTEFQRGIEPASSLAWSGDGNRLAWHTGWKVYAIDIQTRKKLLDERTGLRIFQLAIASIDWAPDGIRLVASSIEGDVLVFDTNSGKKVSQLRGHQSDVHAVAWSPVSQKLASAGYDQIIRIWNPETGEIVNSLRGHSKAITDLRWGSKDLLASAGRDGHVYVWNTVSNQEASVISLPDFKLISFPHAVSWRPDGKQLAVACISGGGGIFEVTSFSLVTMFQSRPPGTWQPEGDFALSYKQQFAGASITNPESGRVIRPLENASAWGSIRPRWHPKGIMIAGASKDRPSIWDPETGKVIRTFKGAGRAVQFAWNREGKQLASADSAGNVTIWDVQSAEKLRSWKAHDRFVSSIDWNGNRLATASWDRTIRIWNTESGRLEKTLTGHNGPVSVVAWSPDGRRLASASGQWFFFTEPGKPRNMWLEDSDRSVKIWDVEAGIEVLNLDGHKSYVTDVAWSPDGKHLASVGRDITLRVWKTPTEQTRRQRIPSP